MVLTKKGRALQAKAEAGTPLVFTRVKMGDGQLKDQIVDNLTNLISPKKELNINSVKAEGDGLCRVRTHLTNIAQAVGLFVYEIGLFALDPDEGEILYGYASAYEPDFLPPEGGSTLINHQFDIMVIVGNATNISATIDVDGYVSQADFEEWKNRLLRMLAQLEIDGRIPESNKGTFVDTFDGITPSRLTLLDATADLTGEVMAGTTTLPVVITKGSFAVGEEIIIMDDQNVETLVIAAVNDNEITVQQLVHGFKKGATIARSTAVVNTADKAMKFPVWGTYSINVVEVA